jgi:hypothetical protein
MDSPIQSLRTLTKASRKSIVDKSPFEDVTKGFFDGHARLGCVSCDFDLVRLLGNIICT